MAGFKIDNAPTNISMDTFRAKLDDFGGPAKQCRYAVRILPTRNNQLLAKGYGPFLNDMIYLTESAELPGRGMEVMDVRYYGPGVQMPFASKYEQQTSITFICRAQSYEREMFDDWMDIINPSDTFDFNYLDQYVSEIQIFQLADWSNQSTTKPVNGSIEKMTQFPTESEVVYKWSLLRAWPLQVYAQPVTWADQDYLRLSVTFSYRYWYRPNKDNTPSRRTLEFTTG